MSDVPPPTTPRLTVALTNYNGRELLEKMLPSLAAQTYPDFATLVVDDCSTDDSVAYLRRAWPDVEVVELAENSGVTAAMNAAVTRPRSELVALFNNDMELRPECLAELVAALDAHAEAGSSTPKMLDFNDRNVLDGAGDLLNWRGGGRRRGHGERDVGQYETPEEIFGPCGGAAMYRRAVLEQVGGFDEAYHAYYEDIDWAFRAQLAGHSCRYVPSAVLHHHGSATLGKGMTDFNAHRLWRNPIWLIAKCFPLRCLLRHAPSLLRGQAGNLYTALRERKLRVWARAMRDAARGLPAALRKRGEVQRSRTVTIARLEQAARAGWDS
ncbi:MAG TPA: glycosyltransferase family 2 protein [Solirubrobacteraceae bacterium]|nr:glycosyltransferase family 2 protein [Solirubrobacteraceae bacterium]